MLRNPYFGLNDLYFPIKFIFYLNLIYYYILGLKQSNFRVHIERLKILVEIIMFELSWIDFKKTIKIFFMRIKFLIDIFMKIVRLNNQYLNLGIQFIIFGLLE